MAQQLPQPGGDQRSQSKFIVFENFEKMNTQSIRQSLSEKELAWLENLQPIAGNNLTTVPAPGRCRIGDDRRKHFHDVLCRSARGGLFCGFYHGGRRLFGQHNDRSGQPVCPG